MVAPITELTKDSAGGFRIKRKRIKTSEGNTYQFEVNKVGRAQRRKVIDGTKMSVRNFAVDITKTTLTDIRAASLSVASGVAAEQEAKGNPPRRILIDKSPVKSPARLMRTIDVYFGTDASAAMAKVQKIVQSETAKYIAGVTWTWIRADGPTASYGPINGNTIMNEGDRMALVPRGPTAAIISLRDIAYKINIHPVTFENLGAARQHGFLRGIVRKARYAVSPLFYVRLRFSEAARPGSGGPSKGLWNPIRKKKGLAPVNPKMRGDPVYIMTLGLGGTRSTIGRRT